MAVAKSSDMCGKSITTAMEMAASMASPTEQNRMHFGLVTGQEINRAPG
jgi:hypothetical protein